ncbi:MAG: invasion associated locus B family protein, partial [Hyphomicrobiales bacterium]|nr:invasion associated locus B family protein [Hyphomicrobiales bacterium]
MMLSSRIFAGLAVALALVSGGLQPSFAQQPAKPPAKPAAPAPAPTAAPAAPAPTIVQLKPEPSQQDWLKVCGEDQVAKKKVCYTTRDFVSDQDQPVVAVAVYDVQGEPQKVVRFLMPLGLLMQPGIRFAADQGQGIPGKYAICFPNGCFAEGAV